MMDRIDKIKKRFIAMKRELSVVDEKRRHIPRVKLSTPIQSGWYVELKISDKYTKHKDYQFLTDLIGEKGKRTFTRDPKLVKIVRKGRSMFSLRSYFTYTNKLYGTSYHGPNIGPITIEEYDSLNKRHKSYFFPKHNKDGKIRHYTTDIPEFFLEMRCKQRILYDLPGIDGKLESLSELLFRKIWYNYDKYNPFRKNYRSRYDQDPNKKLRISFKSALKTYQEDEDIYSKGKLKRYDQKRAFGRW